MTDKPFDGPPVMKPPKLEVVTDIDPRFTGFVAIPVQSAIVIDIAQGIDKL